MASVVLGQIGMSKDKTLSRRFHEHSLTAGGGVVNAILQDFERHLMEPR